MRRRLPKGIQNFEEMRKGDYLYVDTIGYSRWL
jgi:hypothetical protein